MIPGLALVLSAVLAAAPLSAPPPEVIQGKGAGPHPGVLFVHWLGDPPTTNHTEFERDAHALAEAGVTSVLVDAMWSRPGWFGTVGKYAPDDIRGARAQVGELHRALDLLEAQPGVDKARIAYVGHDFGAMFGTLLAAQDARPRWYVLMAGVPTLTEWYLLGKPSPGLVYERRMAAYAPSLALGKAHPEAVLFQFADHDRYVTPAQAAAFMAPLRGPRTVVHYNTDHALAVEAAYRDRQDWLRRHLLR
jgi:fermentation-respiration switch protein FrsA (DUF1100 family)